MLNNLCSPILALFQAWLPSDSNELKIHKDTFNDTFNIYLSLQNILK
jgi:hypothetical protein